MKKNIFLEIFWGIVVCLILPFCIYMILRFGGIANILLIAYDFFANFFSINLGPSYVQAFACIFTALFFSCLAYFLGSFFTIKTDINTYLSVLCFALLLFVVADESRGVYYDKESKKPVTHYIKTTQGYEFSDAPDINKTFQIKYKGLNPQVISDIEYFNKNNEHKEKKEEELYTDATGKTIHCWYYEDEEKVKIFPYPGFLPKTKDLLLPADNKKCQELHNKEIDMIVKQLEKSRSMGNIAWPKEIDLTN
ncbi:hypothetical protein C0583_06445 [Candidatus Parcubacteria bacterium]|nr:MAG: hypothetical protein C0583_06445 [Candidatus Parcubacteria bacterium]